MPPEARLEFAQPMLFDEVARALPELRLAILELGQPFFDQTLTLVSKQPNVWAVVSGLYDQTQRLHRVLVEARQSGASAKLLFGSGYPLCDPQSAITNLYELPTLTKGLGLPSVSRQSLRQVVHRDALEVLGLPAPPGGVTGQPRAAVGNVINS
jgi:predicted TIM-barrel fold metal-dependent hydrolase